jgi:hypothetical protein
MSVATTAIAVDLLLQLLSRATEVSMAIKQARAEGRELTQVELDRLVQGAADARQAAVDAIARARGN